ncbi:MAG TPA: aldehyde dehydrogenase family protein, partial [Planctomycetaceae bacterium]|nr:aldehyde dehydrogenase family protein [Planctomycetaceae bacterium]
MSVDIRALFQRLNLSGPLSGVCAGDWTTKPDGPELVSYNPATGEPLGRVRTASPDDYERVIAASQAAFERWRRVPAPVRGDYVRKLALALREVKNDLGLLVTLESGKIASEGRGEVQEMIDISDFAVGLSRQLYGLTMPSERPEHRLFEQWHPLGPVGVLTAFNFPVAVWAWNAMLAAVCGDAVVWKPSPLTPLTAVAVQHICQRVMQGSGFEAVFSLCLGADRAIGEAMARDVRLPLVSATGSTQMGQHVGQLVASRLGRSLLELGGNNAMIVTETADLSLALRAVVFAAAGTAGQRCTTLRRLIVHESIAEKFTQSLVQAYRSLPIGDPWDDGMLIGPLIRATTIDTMHRALADARAQGGDILCGGDRLDRPGWFVTPAVVRAQRGMAIVRTETFAPILYVLTYRDFDEAVAIQNDSDHGLSSAVFTDRVSEAERFLSPWGSDCGIANVNIGTSGAEIGGAFGGEKGTGGGREAGSDAWKAYMRRQTCTVNFGQTLPLAQGVEFDVPT